MKARTITLMVAIGATLSGLQLGMPALVHPHEALAHPVADSSADHTIHLPLVARSLPLRGEPVAVLGGGLEAVATDGRHVYAGIGHRIVVIDALDPSGPHSRAETVPFHAPISDMVVEGGLLYAAHASIGSSWYWPSDPDAGMSIWDLRDPALPRRLGVLHTEGVSDRIALRYPLAFVLQRGTDVAIIDVSDPVQPRLRSTVSAGATTDFAFTGDVLWLYARTDCTDRACSQSRPRLMAFDLSDPDHPKLLQRIEELSDPPGRLVGLGPVLHTAVGRVDTRRPVEQWQLEPPGDHELLQVFGSAGRSWAIHRLSSGNARLAELLPGDDLAPVLRDQLDLPQGFEVGRASGAGFVANLGESWRWLDLAAEPGPRLTTSQTVERISIGGDPDWRRLEVFEDGTGDASGLQIDLRDPERPRLDRLLGRTELDGQFWGDIVGGPDGVVYATRSLYDAETRRGQALLTVIDRGAPSRPRVAAELPLQGTAEHLRVAGDRLYVAEWHGDRDRLGARAGRLSIWDLTEPLQPLEIGAIEHIVVAGLAVWGGQVIVEARGESRYELRAYDLSDPASPVELLWPEQPRAGDGLLVEEDRLIAIGPGRRIRLFDLTAGTPPALRYDREVSAWPDMLMTTGSYRMAGSDRLLVGTESSSWTGPAGVLSISLAESGSPRLIDRWVTPSVLGLDCLGSRCFVATREGVWVYDLPLSAELR